MSAGTTLCTSPTMPRSDREDRRLAVLVDRDDVVAVLHADEVLRRAGDAERDVHLRLHRLAGLADLQRVRHPTGVDDRTRRAPRALEQLGELLDERRVVLGRADARDRRTRRPPPLRASGPAAPRRGARAPSPRPRGRRRPRATCSTSAAPPPDSARPRTTSAGSRSSAAPPPLSFDVDERDAAEDRGAEQRAPPSSRATCRWSARAGRASPTGAPIASRPS